MTVMLRPLAKCGNVLNSLPERPIHVEAIQYALDCLNATRADLARNVNVTRQTVYRWLTGETAPTSLQLALWPEFHVAYHDWCAQIAAERMRAA